MFTGLCSNGSQESRKDGVLESKHHVLIIIRSVFAKSDFSERTNKGMSDYHFTLLDDTSQELCEYPWKGVKDIYDSSICDDKKKNNNVQVHAMWLAVLQLA